MTALVNNGAGGSQGTTVTALNSGGASGNAWDTFAGTPTITFDNTRGYSPFAYKSVISGIVTSQQMGWSTSLGTVTSLYGHIYVYSSAVVTGARTGLVRMSSGGTQVARISMETDGTITFRNSGNGATLTFVNHMPTNQWFRIEYKVLPAVSNGTLEMKLYLNAASSTPDETLTSTVAALGAANIDTVMFGNFTTAAGPAWTAWLAHMNVDTTGYPAPITFLSTSDSGSGADAATLTAAISTGDTASGIEAQSPSLTATDAAAGADAISARSVTGTDTGAAADVISAFAMTSADTASGVDASTLVATLTDADTGAGTDAAVLATALTVGDTAAAVDSAALNVSLSAGDTATAAEATPAAQLTAADASTASDAATTAASMAVAESGTAADSAQLSASIAASDTASAGDAATVDQSTHETVDDASGVVDAATLIAQLAVADAGSAIDAASVAASLTVADGAHGVDSALLHVSLTVGDTAHTVDAATITSGAGNYTGSATTSGYGGAIAVADLATGSATTDSYGGEVSWPH